MRRLISILTIVILSTTFGTAWAERCLVGVNDYGTVVADPIWCDDFENYCKASDGPPVVEHEQWPGYPGKSEAADNPCTTGLPRAAAWSWYNQPVGYLSHNYLNWVFAPEDIAYYDSAHGHSKKHLQGTQDIDNSTQANTDVLPSYSNYSQWFARGERDATSWHSDCFPPANKIYEHLGTQTSFSMIDAIQREGKWPAANSVNGTDAKPLYLKVYWYYQGTYAMEHFLPMYSELSLGADRAPTDYILQTCVNARGPYPTICQQEPINVPAIRGNYPTAECPNYNTHPFPVHAAIAVGMMAFIDRNPCADNHEGEVSPMTWHVSFFDGQQWRQLLSTGVGCGSWIDQCDPPGVVGTNCGCNQGWETTYNKPDDNNKDWVQFYELAIKTSTVEIKHYMKWRALNDYDKDGPWESLVSKPRYYTGPFNTYRQGVAPGCELDPADTSNGKGVWDCKANTVREPFGKWIGLRRAGDIPPPPCPAWSEAAWYQSWADNPVVWGGEPDTGACCLPDLTCEEDKSPSYCEGVSGDFHGGKSCAEVYACCPDLFADSDRDGDVDQVDFAAFQLCYTGSGGGVPPGCECWNRDKNNGVDYNDFTAFNDCWTGPNVPFDPENPGSCVPDWPP